MVLVILAGLGVFLLLVHIVLPILHIADFLSVDMRLPVMMEQVPGGAVELARGTGARVVQDGYAELVLDGASFGQRLVYRVPGLAGAATVLGILWLLWRLVRLVRSGPFSSVAVRGRLLGIALLIAALGVGGPVFADWRVRMLIDGAGATVSGVPESPLPYALATLTVVCAALAAGRGGMARDRGTRAAAEERRTSPRLSLSEPELEPEAPRGDREV
ncbi:hypothetical protein [Streptomyces peucetius]|uniref:DUF2975 domain-containing protein n=1 Tax=Streptomyces peucetius TaxID=1950 RepID=A0ABY6IAM1_STRPE|nr:hypothetical protein [Streptomyces peucetius]UYQ63906.1 hypothetical protein OGH68_22215 [Streptomyces peucetius]